MELLNIFKNPQTLEDKELISKYLELENSIKDLEIMKKTYESELRARTGEKDTVLGNYSISFKSSKLFDKAKAKEFILKNNLQDRFKVDELDYKKVQNYIKAVAVYDDFVKESKKRIDIKRK